MRRWCEGSVPRFAGSEETAELHHMPLPLHSAPQPPSVTTALAAALAANAVPATISAAIVIDGYTGWCPLCHDVSPCHPLVPEVTVSWLELLGCILTLRKNLPFLATDPQLLGCILTLRENLPFLATDPNC